MNRNQSYFLPRNRKYVSKENDKYFLEARKMPMGIKQPKVSDENMLMKKSLHLYRSRCIYQPL